MEKFGIMSEKDIKRAHKDAKKHLEKFMKKSQEDQFEEYAWYATGDSAFAYVEDEFYKLLEKAVKEGKFNEFFEDPLYHAVAKAVAVKTSLLKGLTGK